MSDFTASARVRVTIEVLNLGPYGADWKAGDIHDQVGQHVPNRRSTFCWASRTAARTARPSGSGSGRCLDGG